MRIPLISDVHAHLTALEAVPAHIRLRDAGSTNFLGDLATIGPHPRQVLARLSDLGCRRVRGTDAIMPPKDHGPGWRPGSAAGLRASGQYRTQRYRHFWRSPSRY